MTDWLGIDTRTGNGGNTWTPIASMFAARKDFDSVVLNGQIYVIGGRGGSQYLGAVERYTP